MKALVAFLCDPCLHLFMIGIVLASLTEGVSPVDDELVAFAERAAICPICQQTTIHLEWCPRPVVRMAAEFPRD
jgi:hypothetical protein